MPEEVCPIGPLSIELFDAGMDEVKRMYALVVADNIALRERARMLEAYIESHPSDAVSMAEFEEWAKIRGPMVLPIKEEA